MKPLQRVSSIDSFLVRVAPREDNSWDVRVGYGSAASILLGFAALMTGSQPTEIEPLGVILTLTGGLGLLIVWRRQFILARLDAAEKHSNEVQEEKRVARRTRDKSRQFKHRQEQARITALAERQALSRVSDRNTRANEEKLRMVSDAARVATLEIEASRIANLSDEDIVAEITALFANNRCVVSPPFEGGESGDMLVVNPFGITSAVRCLPSKRCAEQADLLSMTEWMKSMRVVRGYMISTGGFTEEVVLEVAFNQTNVTLVEPQLIASWLVNGIPVSN